MAFTRAWDETDPANSDNVSDGAAAIRNFKGDDSERMQIDHEWGNAGTTNDDGEHNKVTLKELASDPANVANKGFVYTKDSGGHTELYYEDDSGSVIKLTETGYTATKSGSDWIHGWMADGTMLLSTEISITINAGYFFNSGAHGLANPYTNDTIVSVIPRWALASTKVTYTDLSGVAGLIRIDWDDTDMTITRDSAVSTIPYTMFVIYKG
ncbi:MAG: hypothetical protein GY861_01785 [bacterium]|nr:hypothetical protein [bacterium]